MKLQEFFFREALSEIGITHGAVEIDHRRGLCSHNEVGVVPIVFPMSMVRKIQRMPKIKTTDYAFRGMITPHREWILKYTNVAASDYGRNPRTKYTFDEFYYGNLCRARFGISPTGDCPWSYRFLESIMCHAIPVLSDTEEDVFSDNFHFYRDSEKKDYDANKCDENFEKFLKHHTLLSFAGETVPNSPS